MQLAIVLLVLFVSTETTDDACFSNESCTTTEIAITDVTESDDLNITTTEMPPIKEVILQQSFSTGCFCDLQSNFCDVNCCCDADCSYENKLAFSYCKKEENRYVDTRFCDYMEYIYKNNTPYEWDVNQNGLFCIVKSNLPPQYTVQQKTEIKTLEDAELQITNKYLWPDYENELFATETFNLSERFIHGKSMLVIKNNATLQKFQLPIAFLTNMCGKHGNILYLENFKSKCAQFDLSEKNQALNPETYFKNLTLLAITLQPNQTLNLQNCCVTINAKICDEDLENCKNISANRDLRRRCHERECLFLARKIKYDIYHNGTKGVQRADVYMFITNETFGANRIFYQDFEVNFIWGNYTLNYSDFLSGNPGYKTEKAILSGTLVTLWNITNIPGTNLTEIKKYYKIARIYRDVTKNFLIFPANRNGFCTMNNNTYNGIEFGLNSIFKCRLVGAANTTQTPCKHIQKRIFDEWSVIYENTSAKVVGRFGNANANNIGEWVKILQNKQPLDILNNTVGLLLKDNETILCKKIVNKVSVTIFHSRVDTKFYANQEKIVGVLYKFSAGSDFEFALKEGQVVFDVPTHVDVVFVDTTKPKVKKFVDPPTFKIRLPYDFFYPFIKVHNEANSLYLSAVLVIIVFFICFLM